MTNNPIIDSAVGLGPGDGAVSGPLVAPLEVAGFSVSLAAGAVGGAVGLGVAGLVCRGVAALDCCAAAEALL